MQSQTSVLPMTSFISRRIYSNGVLNPVFSGVTTDTQNARFLTFNCTPDISGNFKRPNPRSFSKVWTIQTNGRYNGFSSTDFGVNEDFIEVVGPIFGSFNSSSFPHDSSSIPDFSFWETRCYNDYQSRILKAIKDTELNLAVSIGESPELLALKRQLTKSVTNLVRTVKRTPFRSISAAVAGAWLTWSYAVSPVLSDIEAIANWTSSHLFTQKVKASAKLVRPPTMSPVGTRGINTKEFVFKYKGKLSFRIIDAEQFDRMRLGFTAPASTVWNLIPFSFVIDWVYNIGNYLEGLEAQYHNGLGFIEGWQTFTYAGSSISRYHGFYSSQNGPDLIQHRDDLTGTTIFRGSERSIVSSIPRPRLPTIDLDLNSNQLLSAAALLRALFIK